MKRYISIFFWLCCLAAFAACGPAPVATPDGATPLPTAEPGNTTITGRIISSSTGKPVGDTVLRLAEVYHVGDESAYVLDGARSPATVTDTEGRFVFANVPAREYVLFLSADEQVNAAVTEAPDKAKIWDARDGSFLDIGEVRVQWP